MSIAPATKKHGTIGRLLMASLFVCISFAGTLPHSTDELFSGYPSGLLTFASATCMVFILVGVPGNLITIIALARCKKVSEMML